MTVDEAIATAVDRLAAAARTGDERALEALTVLAVHGVGLSRSTRWTNSVQQGGLSRSTPCGPTQSKGGGLPRSSQKKSNFLPEQEGEERLRGEKDSECAPAAAGGLTQSTPHGPSQSTSGGPSQSTDDGPTQSGALRVAMCDAWDGVGGAATSGSNRSRIHAIEPRLRLLASARGVEPGALFRAAVARFKADPRVRQRRLGLQVLLEDLDHWLDEPPAAARKGAAAPVSTDDDFAAMERECDRDLGAVS